MSSDQEAAVKIVQSAQRIVAEARRSQADEIGPETEQGKKFFFFDNPPES